MLSINTNVIGAFAHRQAGMHRSAAATALQRLSSGLKINSAADDPSGLAIAQKMKAQLRALEATEQNRLDELSRLETQDGVASGISDILNRMNELATKAASGTLDDNDRKNIDAEYQQLLQEIARQKETSYNGMKLFSDQTTGIKDKNSFTVSGKNLDAYLDGLNKYLGSISGAATIKDEKALAELGLGETVGLSDKERLRQAVIAFTKENGERLLNSSGGGENDSFSITIGNGNIAVNGSGNGGLYGLEGSSLATAEDAQKTLGKLKLAISRVSSERGDYGAKMSRMEYTLNNLTSMQGNLAEALSRVQDADMAKEMMNWVRENALAAAADFVMSQSMQAPKQTLNLLQSML